MGLSRILDKIKVNAKGTDGILIMYESHFGSRRNDPNR